MLAEMLGMQVKFFDIAPKVRRSPTHILPVHLWDIVCFVLLYGEAFVEAK